MPELTVYLNEALRTWNSLTSFWRADMVFPLQKDVWWYYLPLQPGTLRAFTVTDRDLVSQIEYHLLEPLTPSYPMAWTGSSQFTLQDILSAIQFRRDEVRGETGCTITRTLVPAAQVNRTYLADNVIDIRRVAWIPETGNGYSIATLRPSDDWAEGSFNFGYTTAAHQPPTTYRQSAQPPLAFDVDYIPPVPGQYETLTVNAGPTVSASFANLIGIPDDWSWTVKFGALARLFGRESLAKDPLREQYCQKRFDEGMGLLNQASALVAERKNDLPMPVDAVRNGDDFNPLWQAAAEGTPTSAYTAGLNLVAFGPMPDNSTAYSATCSVVENAPVGGTYVQVARNDYDAVLGYAQHLAMIKAGGQEFMATIPLLSGFFAQASLYNSKLKGMGQFAVPMYEVSQLPEQRDPRFATVTPQTVGA